MSEVGQGYAYQWETAAAILLRVLRKCTAGDELDRELEWLGRVEHVCFEGDVQDVEALEDLTLVGADEKRLSIQIKKRASGGWTMKVESLAKFARRASASASDTHHFVMLTNASLAPNLRTPHGDHGPRTLRFVQFLGLTTHSGDVPTGGVGKHLWSVLDALGVADIRATLARLCKAVQDWSVVPQGTILSLSEVRDRVREHMGLKRFGPQRVASMAELLAQRSGLSGDKPDAGPSWAEIEGGKVYLDTELVTRAEEMLAQHRIVLVEGPQASGKSVLAAVIAQRAEHGGAWAAYWDFANGPPPNGAAQYVAAASAYASLEATKPLVVLENVHLGVEAVKQILALGSLSTLLLTGRPHDELRHLPVVSLGERLDERGWQLFDWYFEQVCGCSEGERMRIRRSADFAGIVADQWVLWLSMQGFDRESYRLPWSRRYEPLIGRLATNLRKEPNLASLLYVAAGLGRYEIPLDLRASARMLAIDFPSVLRAVEIARTAGILDLNEAYSTCRFWHASLARLYWEALRLFFIDDVDPVRERMAGAP
ncbi:MAG: hypothetical protein IV100_30995 [Myxococcales bacterium]|nr:hypothetical protein [Myxococcales bacterium]